MTTRRFLSGTIAALMLVSVPLSPLAAGAPSIFVGPNIRITRDSVQGHVEPAVTGSAPSLLFASATLGAGDGNEFVDKAYLSNDNGNTWSSIWFPELTGPTDPTDMTLSGDTSVAVGANKRLFFVGNFIGGAEGATQITAHLYHSDDNGRAWSPHRTLAIVDHPVLFTDAARRLVVVVGMAGPPFRMVAYVSRNNGDTFSKIVYAGPDKRIDQYRSYDICELPDGSIFLPFQAIPLIHRGARPRVVARPIEGVVLDARSLKLSKPRVLFDWTFPANYSAIMASSPFVDFSDLVFRAYANNIYAIENIVVGNVYRIAVRISRDRGRTWSGPRYVAPENGKQHQVSQSAAVNRDGVLGIAWLQTLTRDAFTERFTASIDGGRTFLPSRVISTAISKPLTAENLTGAAFAYRDAKGILISQRSPFLDRPSGGDFFGMAADAQGAFHPIWVDHRDGSGQLYTAGIAVQNSGPECSSRNSSISDITKSIQILADPMRVDMARGEMVFPIRLKNLGSRSITGPVTFKVKQLALAMSGAPAVWQPRIAGATNGISGAGATLDFTRTFGDYEFLPPGGVSNAVNLRVHFGTPFVAPQISGTVEGAQCDL